MDLMLGMPDADDTTGPTVRLVTGVEAFFGVILFGAVVVALIRDRITALAPRRPVPSDWNGRSRARGVCRAIGEAATGRPDSAWP